MSSVRKSSSFAIQFPEFSCFDERLSNIFNFKICFIFIKELYYWFIFSAKKILHITFAEQLQMCLSGSNSPHTEENYFVYVSLQYWVDVVKGFF